MHTPKQSNQQTGKVKQGQYITKYYRDFVMFLTCFDIDFLNFNFSHMRFDQEMKVGPNIGKGNRKIEVYFHNYYQVMRGLLDHVLW